MFLKPFISVLGLGMCMALQSQACTDSSQATNNSVASITLPQGFSATVFADGFGRARHIAVAPNGNVYIKLERKKDGNTIYFLKDTNNDGVADIVKGLGDATGTGTGIAISNGYLYASSDENVYRYKLNTAFEVENAATPELIVKDLWSRRQHASKSIALDGKGNLFVNIGAPSNSCQERDRSNGSIGMLPCPILDSAGGIWVFKADVKNQSYAQGVRYATGLRNVVGLDWNTQTNSLFVMQHGRDMLYQNWPQFYDATSGANNPAEVMFEVKQGFNGGWPYVYHDYDNKAIMMAPEYGGDGKLTYEAFVQAKGNQALPNIAASNAKNDASVTPPVAYYPAHMAPNALQFIHHKQWPSSYQNGAFIAFHGSWNRSPQPQEGYYVVFQPFKDGKPYGKWEIFADGFAGANKSPGKAEHRPCGLALGADGALYITDDVKGTIYRVTYNGK
ncbi:MAG: PQQ-dependent sugar dehydrogenase [Chitinophagaceae bacterium]